MYFNTFIMKKLILIASLFFLGYAQSQTTIFEDDFESGDGNWILNDEGTGGNTWIVNKVYEVDFPYSLLLENTPNQPAAITGSPNSKYLHIHAGGMGGIADNALFDASDFTSGRRATMEESVSTLGLTDVTFSFWYLCNGGV